MFRFKRFAVGQQGAAMKVGTDGVLIGAWARVGAGQVRCLDIGTGTGLIAMMLAQRTEEDGAVIDAVEIDDGSCLQAQENVESSQWGSRIHIFNMPVQQFAANHVGQYDHIVSNPPYFVDSLLPSSDLRSVARHTKSLPYEELLSSTGILLAPDGYFSVIVPFDTHKDFIRTASTRGLACQRRCMVFPLAGKPCKRVMLEFSHSNGSSSHVEETELVLESAPEGFTREYKELTRDFYLKF